MGEGATASWDPKDVTEPLDRAAMAKMAKVVYDATESLNNYEHSKALETIEDFFWQFCDDYIELVKNRAYGTAESTGVEPSPQAVKSARTTLGLGLDAFARLLAPFLPYTTEEVWSWMHAGEGSVHHAPWPKPITYATAAFKASPELLTQAGAALTALRGIKSKAKVSMKTPILSVMLSVNDELHDAQRRHLATSPRRHVSPVASRCRRPAISWRSSPVQRVRAQQHRPRRRTRRTSRRSPSSKASSANRRPRNRRPRSKRANPEHEMREGRAYAFPHFMFRRQPARNHLLFSEN